MTAIGVPQLDFPRLSLCVWIQTGNFCSPHPSPRGSPRSSAWKLEQQVWSGEAVGWTLTSEACVIKLSRSLFSGERLLMFLQLQELCNLLPGLLCSMSPEGTVHTQVYTSGAPGLCNAEPARPRRVTLPLPSDSLVPGSLLLSHRLQQ